MSWKGEKTRHALSARGIKTSLKSKGNFNQIHNQWHDNYSQLFVLEGLWLGVYSMYEDHYSPEEIKDLMDEHRIDIKWSMINALKNIFKLDNKEAEHIVQKYLRLKE